MAIVQRDIINLATNAKPIKVEKSKSTKLGNKKFCIMTGKLDPNYKTRAPQVQKILEYMDKNRQYLQGKTIIENMIAEGFKTKIQPAVLFAYYARELEHWGVVSADQE